MPRGATRASSDRLADVTFSVTVEDCAYPLVRVVSDAPSETRSGFAGPLAEHEALLTEVLTYANHRARMAGAQSSLGIVHSWRFTTQVTPHDLSLVRDGLERLLTGDEGLLRVFLSLPAPKFSDVRIWDGPDPLLPGPARSV